MTNPPPVPADLDLRRLWWMKAWHQVPAGSLPNDDASLCHLAGLGRDVKTWKKIRADALRGFSLCDDGRLYHAFLCKMALEAHDEMMRFETRRQRDRDRKSGGTSTGIPAETRPADEDRSDGIPAENAGQDKTRQELSPQAPRRATGFTHLRPPNSPSRILLPSWKSGSSLLS